MQYCWFRKKQTIKDNALTFRVNQGKSHESVKDQDAIASFMTMIIKEDMNIEKERVGDHKRNWIHSSL